MSTGPDHEHDHDHGHDPGHDHDPGVRHEADVETAGSRVTMNVTVDADTVTSNVQEVARIFRQRAKLPGFRRGKTPMSMIRQRFKEEIREHVLEHMIPRHVAAEIDARGLKPLHNPILDKVDFDPEEPLVFTVHFDVELELEAAGYKDLAATKTIYPVTDDAVDKAVGNMREEAAKLESIDEGETARANDYVRISISIFPRDGKGKKLAEEDRYVHVGHEEAIPGLNSQLEGLKVGDTREFVTELGAPYPNHLLAGKEVTCRLEVSEVKRRHLPDIDDEFARDLGAADLEELRAKTREDFARHLEDEAERDVERQLLDRVLEVNPVDAPESMVEVRLDQAVRRAAEDLARQGIDPRHSIDWTSFRADNRPGAQRAVAEELLLDSIAAAEEIEVDDAEVVAEIKSHQEGHPGGTSAAVVQQMRKEGSFEALRKALVRRGALDFVKQHATIETVEGTPDVASEPAE